MDGTTLKLREDVGTLIESGRLYLIRPETLGWAAIPLHQAALLQRFDGRTAADAARDWPDDAPAFDTFVRRLRDAEVLEGPDSTPPAARESRHALIFVLKLTENCNLRCTYCYAEGGFGTRRMDFDTLRASVDYAFSRHLGEGVVFHFHGGEPTLNWPMVEQGAEYVHERSAALGIPCKLAITTNGFGLTEARLDTLQRLGFSIRLSFDGPPEVHDVYRVSMAGTATSERVLRTLHMLRERGDVAGWSVLSTITRLSSERLPEICDYFQDLGVPSVGFIPCRKQGYATGRNEYVVDDGAYVRANVAVIDAINDGRIARLRVESLIKMMRQLLTNNLEAAPDRRHRCGAGQSMLVSDVGGKLLPCDNIPTDAFPPIGDVHAPTAAVTGFSDLYGNRLPDGECTRCAWRAACHGGCPGQALANDGDFHAKDSLSCLSSKTLYPRLLAGLTGEGSLRDYFSRHQNNRDYDWLVDA